jgi:3-phosphoshikimate 1-carboxyvinyltransferase
VNAGRLRIKESDRLATVAGTLGILGASVTERPEGLLINGVPRLHGGTVSSCNDHRIAMMAAVSSLVSDGRVVIEGSDAVSKSYPDFFDVFTGLGFAGNLEAR